MATNVSRVLSKQWTIHLPIACERCHAGVELQDLLQLARKDGRAIPLNIHRRCLRDAERQAMPWLPAHTAGPLQVLVGDDLEVIVLSQVWE